MILSHKDRPFTSSFKRKSGNKGPVASALWMDEKSSLLTNRQVDNEGSTRLQEYPLQRRTGGTKPRCLCLAIVQLNAGESKKKGEGKSDSKRSRPHKQGRGEPRVPTFTKQIAAYCLVVKLLGGMFG